jgi:hypothetical protein
MTLAKRLENRIGILWKKSKTLEKRAVLIREGKAETEKAKRGGGQGISCELAASG